MIGIYKITNTITNEFYIGQSNDIERRFMEHRSPKNLREGKSLVALAMNEYGLNSFLFEVIEECEEAQLSDIERYYIKKLNPEYNQKENGYSVPSDVRESIRQSLKVHWANLSEDQKQKIIQNNLTGPSKGHTVSEETRHKLRVANIGKKLSPEHRKHISEGLKGKPRDNSSKCKSVEMLDVTNGSVIMVFESVKEAAQYVGVHPGAVTKALKGKQKTAGKMCWRYLQECRD
jgi:group I intron endonuclease